MTWLPVRQQGMQAASGTTPFAGLFLGFSFFLMASAVMLIALLFQLGVEQRARMRWARSWQPVFRPAGSSRLYMAEAMLVATAGALLGVGAGIGYGWLMVYGMGTWWVAATVTPFLQLHVSDWAA